MSHMLDEPTRNMARLLIEHGPRQGDMVELTASPFVIGRGPECNLHVAHDRVSRHHAEIVREAERYFLCNLYSHNGTYLNGERLKHKERRLLNPGDRIQLAGALVFRFDDPGATLSDTAGAILLPGVWLDPVRRDVCVRGKRLEPPLAPKLFGLLELLMEHPGHLVSHEEIGRHVWPELRGGVTSQMIDSVVYRLSRRLADTDPDHDYIERLRGRGIRLVQRE